MKLEGSERKVLKTLQGLQGDPAGFVDEARIADKAELYVIDVRDWLETLEGKGLVERSLGTKGFSACITALGRQALRTLDPPPGPTAVGRIEPKAAMPKGDRAPKLPITGRERALVVGISDYLEPIPKLPAVANDVREIAKLLKSTSGQFSESSVSVLVDRTATQQAVLDSLAQIFGNVQADDVVFGYMAGHGKVVGDEYFFVAHDTRPDRLAATGVPLAKIREFFDRSPSRRAFLWLDFCHSGGMLARELGPEPDDREVIERTLKVVQGEGKLVIAACTPSQSAWESPTVGHGLFTDALLRGLKGGAAKDGEVTINSLFDFIDKQIGSDRQRPMMFGQMKGRVVLMHYEDPARNPCQARLR